MRAALFVVAGAATLGLCVGGCSSSKRRPAAGVQSVPAAQAGAVEVNANAIQFFLENSYARGIPEQVVHVRNRSARTIRVTQLELSNCVNIQDHCGTITVRVDVPPGATRAVRRFLPRTRDAVFSFSYRSRYEVIP
ncbi:MAG: hypothetical protein ABR543_17295 [Gemmatimonadaceae bacterium]